MNITFGSLHLQSKGLQSKWSELLVASPRVLGVNKMPNGTDGHAMCATDMPGIRSEIARLPAQ